MNKIKEQILYYYEHFYLFLTYIGKHPLAALLLLAGTVTAFAPYAFATDYYIDSEIIINLPGTNYNWLEIGRYGLVFVRRLLGTNWYNPYYTGILFLLFLWLTGMTLSYLAEKLFPTLPTAVTILGSLLFVTYPTFTEQYYFQFQSAEVAFGLWLSVIAAGLFYLFVKDRRIGCFVLTIPIYVLTFSIYQSFIPFTLCCYLGIFLALVLRKESDKALIIRGIAGSIGHFLLSFVTSQAIEKICFPSNEYLGDQVIWGSTPTLFEAAKSVVGTSLRMLVGQGVFYTSILLFAVLMAAAAVWMLFVPNRRAQAEGKDTALTNPSGSLILGTLSAVGIAVTPFILTLLMGENTSVRTQFTYPLAAVLLIYFAVHTLFTPASLCKKLLPALLGLIVLVQIGTVRFIWEAHQFVADHDRQMATKLMGDLYDSYMVCDGGGTILWGCYQPDSPFDEALSQSHSSLFLSVFNLEYDEVPLCYYSTVRILGYMKSMGHDFVLPTHQTQYVAEYHMTYDGGLTTYPLAGSSITKEDSFILNLGNFPQ